MTYSPNPEPLIATLQRWLSDVNVQSQEAAAKLQRAESQASDPLSAAKSPGLVELAREFTALRHEVKLQTKSSRGLDERTLAAVAAIEQAIHVFQSVEPCEAESARRAAMPLVESLVDLDEALRRSQAVMESLRERLVSAAVSDFPVRLAEKYAAQSIWKRWRTRSWNNAVRELWQAEADRESADRRRVVDSFAEGYALIRARVQRAMAKEEIERINCVGLPVDPHTMTVVEIIDEVVEGPGRVGGTVIAEVRPGYRWKDRIVRFAEVSVASLTAS